MVGALKDPDSGRVIKWTAEDIPKMLAAVVTNQYTKGGALAGYAMKALTEKDMGEVDSDLADAAVQLHGLGDLVYG